MLSNKLAITGLAGACIAAAAGGGYLAVRHSASELAVATVQTAGTSSAPVPDTPAGPAPSSHIDTHAPDVVQERPAAQPVRTAAVTAAQPTRTTSAARPAARNAPARTPAAAPQRTALPQQEPAAAVGVPVPDPPVLAHAVIEEALPQTWQLAPPTEEEPAFRELVVPADSVMGLTLGSTISSETAQIEDRVEARVARDVRVGDEIAIPAGSRAYGSVVVVERGGRFREQAELGIRFHTLRLPDGTEIPVSTEAIYRFGDRPGRSSAAKIGGGAVAGAILGGILGGSRGAAIGATSGAGAGTAMVYAGDRSEAMFNAGMEVTARILSEIAVPTTSR